METARHYSKGGAIRHMADGGLVGKIKGLFSSGPKETISERYARQDAELAAKIAARQPKAEPAAAPKAIDGISDYSGMTATQRREKAAGLAKGGAIRGKGTATSDDIPIMASNGEYMVKAAAVKKLGVPFMNKLNSIADHPDKETAAEDKGETAATEKKEQASGRPMKKRHGGAVRKMAGGGLVVYDPKNAYKPNFTMGGGAPDLPEQARIGASPPGTAVGQAQYRPNFTMGANTTTPAAPDPVTDVRAKYNPANGSPEAKAFMAERAANPGPQPASAGASAAPKANPVGGAVRRAGAAVANAGRAVAGNRLVGAVGRAAAPIAAGTTIVNTANTPTEDYETRFGFGPSTSDSPAVNLVRDIGVRALGAASDLGNTLTGGLAGQLYRDKQAQAGQLTPADPVQQAAAAAPRVQPSAPAPATAPAPAPTAGPAAPSGAVRRVGNSYSGTNVAGDITINGQAPRGGFVGGTGDGTFTYGGVGGSGGDAALFEARKGALARGDVDSVKASYGGDFGPQVDPVQQLMNNGRPMTVRKAGAIADLQRSKAATAGATADRKLAQDKFDLERDGAKLDNKAKAQLASLQTAVLDPNTTPEQRKSALAIYRGLTGKAETQNRYTVVPGGQQIDPASGQAFTLPSMVIDNQTGQFVQQKGAQGAQSQNFTQGQTYTDARGNKATWDGQKFVPAS